MSINTLHKDDDVDDDGDDDDNDSNVTKQEHTTFCPLNLFPSYAGNGD